MIVDYFLQSVTVWVISAQLLVFFGFLIVNKFSFKDWFEGYLKFTFAAIILSIITDVIIFLKQ